MTEWAVSLVPVEAITGTSTASTTARNRSMPLGVGQHRPSPVVPATTRPSLPVAARWRATAAGGIEIEGTRQGRTG